MVKEKNRSKFTYQRRTKEDVQAAANQRGGNFDSFVAESIKTYKVRDGKNLIRILPPTWEDARHYAYSIMVNYGIGSDNQSYLSLHHMKREKDPLEEARREAQKDGNDKLAKALEAKKRSAMWVIDRFDEEAGPQFWAAPFTVDRDIAQLCFDEDSNEAILVDDPDEGCDVRFYREGKGIGTKYPGAKMKIMKPAPISEDEDQQAEWLEFITENPIPDILLYHDYDHINDVFGGKAGYDSDDDDEDKRSKRGKRRDDDEDEDEKPARRRVSNSRSRDDEDEDEDEKPVKRKAGKEVPWDEDDEDERKPSRVKAKPKPVVEDEDEDVDEDEVEDEDEEKPSSTKTRAANIKDRLSAARNKRQRA